MTELDENSIYKHGHFTTLLDGTVVKFSLGVRGVAPGSVVVSVWVSAVIVGQVGLWVCFGVYPANICQEMNLKISQSYRPALNEMNRNGILN